jgi:hypothetical protein
MFYANNNFYYFGKNKKQYRLDLDKANNNFTILANAFKDNSPDQGILKETDTLKGFHASQIPTPNTIPASYSNGKLDIDWFPLEDIIDKLLQNGVDNVFYVDGSSNPPYVDISPDSSIIYKIDFSNTTDLHINLPMKENDVLEATFISYPTRGVYKKTPHDPSMSPYIMFFPNHTLTPSKVVYMSNVEGLDGWDVYPPKGYIIDYESTGGTTNFVRLVFSYRDGIGPLPENEYYFSFYDDPYKFIFNLPFSYIRLFIRKNKEINYVGLSYFQSFYYNVYVYRYPRFFIICRSKQPIVNFDYDEPRFGLNFVETTWYSYTPDSVYVPWTSFGTIKSPFRMNGKLIIKRLA